MKCISNVTYNEIPERYKEFRITSYSTDQGLDYMTVYHVTSGICLGSEPVVRDDINQFDTKLQKKIIHEDTRDKLIAEITVLAQVLQVDRKK